MFKAASVQIKMHEFDLEYNLKTAEKYVREAALEGAELILLPETSNLGSLCVTREEILPYAETLNGRTNQFYADLCRELKVYIGFGMVELDDVTDLVYNTLVLRGRKGELIGMYRKTHLFSTETNFLVPGNMGFPVFETEFGRIGMLICEDMVHFETSRLLALKGMDILLMSTCWVDHGPDDTWRTRCAENGVYMIASDWWNTDAEGIAYGGGSCIIDPKGDVMTALGVGDGYVTEDVDISRVNRDEILKGRQKEKYYYLLQDAYLWGSDGLKLPEPVVTNVSVISFEAENLEEYKERLSEKLSACKKEPDLIILPSVKAEEYDVVIKIVQDVVPDNMQECYFVLGCGRLTFLFNKNEILKRYQSVHTSYGATEIADPGEFDTIDTPYGRLGLLSADDLFYPESVRCIGRKGADIICISGKYDREKEFILAERRLYSDIAIAASLKDDGGAYSFIGSPCFMEKTEEPSILESQIDTGNFFLREKIDLRKARLDLYEDLVIK